MSTTSIGTPASRVAPSAPITVDELLRAARAGLHRLPPQLAALAISTGARLVDIRPEAQRRAEGEVPGAIVIERNVLEWRLDPSGDARLPWVTGYGTVLIVMCSEGYASSFAAATLRQLGHRGATDLIGGFQAWRAAGLPTFGGVGSHTDPAGTLAGAAR